MDEHLQHELNKILADLDQQHRKTQPLHGNEPATVRLVDVNITYIPVDEMPSQEPTSEDDAQTVDANTQEGAAPNTDEWQPVQGDTPHISTKRLVFWKVSGAILLATLALVAVLVVLPMLAPVATITIIPVSHQVMVTSNVTVVTGQADASQQQITGRSLSSVNMQQSKTLPTTGKGHQDAQVAHGMVTFYNAAPIVQTLPAGTLLTGKSGVTVATDESVSVPAVVYPTLGQASVQAHAVTAGPGGNLPAGDIYGPCCLLNISAANSACIGGQAGRDYQMVSEQDVSGTAESLKAALQQSATAALKTEAHSDETLLPPACTDKAAADHKAGDEAQNVTVTVEETCSGIAYQTESLQAVMKQALETQASKQVGTGYLLVGDIQTEVKGQDQNGKLQVQGTGTWYARFDNARLRTIAGRIAGKSRADASGLLLHMNGIAQVEGIPDSLPADPAHIRVLVLYAPA